MNHIKHFWRVKIAHPLIGLLKQGLTPQKLALSIALGFILGIFPVLGVTTSLCILATVVFKLNTPAIQLLNFSVYPLQLILLIPFYRAGAWLFGADQAIGSLKALVTLARHNPFGMLMQLWQYMIYAVVVWLLVSPVLAAGVYYFSLILLRRIPLPEKQQGTDEQR